MQERGYFKECIDIYMCYTRSCTVMELAHAASQKKIANLLQHDKQKTHISLNTSTPL